MRYVLDIDQITSLSSKAGIRSLAELCKKAKINKNSITPYIKGERSPFTQVVLDIAEALNTPALSLISTGEDKVIKEIKTRLAPLLEDSMGIFLFGSRARKSNKKFSDIDIGVTGGVNKIDFQNFVSFKSKVDDAFDDYHLSVNLINLDMAPLDFSLNIKEDLVYISGNNNSASYFQGYLSGRKEN